MKIKNSKPMMVLFLVLGGTLFCFGFYYLVDTVWNGFFVDWFVKNYMVSEAKYYAEAGNVVVENGLNWSKLKLLFLTVFIIAVVSFLLVTFMITHFYSKAKIKKSITETSQMLHSYMMDNREAADIFPKEYAEISAQMIEMKSIMQHHEHILKEEATRKNDLIAYLAHDLKTPLTSIIGYLNLVDEVADMPVSQREKYINIALDKSYHLEKLINEFFEITRYNLQQIELEKETIDLYYMLVQMTDEFYPLLHSHGNTTELQVDENMTVYGDAIKLARVFNNILKNAIAYSYPNTAIQIWAEKRETQIQIYFCNKGKTIQPQKLNAIFEKFFRLDEARTTNTGGAGLGLAIAKEIIVLHGGTITAASEQECTTFCISLPACD